MRITKRQLQKIIKEALEEKQTCETCEAMLGENDDAEACEECGGDQSKMSVLQQLPVTLSPGRGLGGELDRTVRKLSYPISGRPNQKGYKF